MPDTLSPVPAIDSRTLARKGGLRYVSDQSKGFIRRKQGKRFIYFDLDGARVNDEAELARIRKLAIPPAYKNVWICPTAKGHLQATGVDARGRKQYRYHAEWHRLRDVTKFHRMVSFGEALPAIRETIKRHMGQRGLGREKVLASVVALLERTLIRVGNEEYARANKSYGLTTLTSEHVELNGATIRFMFTGKAGKTWNLKLVDRRIAKIVRACDELSGQELFKYPDARGHIRDVTSGDVNQYLRDISGESFTAKDFRTWNATVMAAGALLAFAPFTTVAEAKKNVSAAIDAVAQRLGNTPAICRKCYVHPQILTAYMDGELSPERLGVGDTAPQKPEGGLSPQERGVLTFLKEITAS